MPLFVAALVGGLLEVAASLAGRVLLSLGFAVVAYTGINATMTWLKSQALSAFSALPPDVLNIIVLLKVGVAINIVFSALVARLTLMGLTSDTVKRLVMR
jgi:hypothetical protein